VGTIALIVIFHEEIRNFFKSLGSRKHFKFIASLFNRNEETDKARAAVMPIVLACQSMAQQKVGALIVIERQVPLDDIISTGETLNSDVSQRLIESIFFKNAPLHDGGMVISGDRVVAAKCVLPSTQQEVPKAYGMRHRAALGMSEVSDAIVIAVSEETGGISLAHDSVIKRNIDPKQLQQSIRKLMHINNKRRAEKEQAEE
jgi:uncharacterized protein (TIGR00159 family)